MNGPNIRFNVKAFGARGDGVSLDTEAIQKAIDSCAENGGGWVDFPSGTYLCGTVYLKSRVRLEIGAGAVLKGSETLSDYEDADVDDFCILTGSLQHFIRGVNLHDVAICGAGVIDGNMAVRKEKGPVPERARNFVSKRGPLTILFERCRDVTIQDVTVVRSPGWCTTFLECEDVRILRVTVRDGFADGINIVSCRQVLYDGCLIEGSGDDPLCIKNEGRPERPCYNNVVEDVIVTNTVIRNSTHPAIKIGTGTSGVFRNIQVSNCIFDTVRSMFTIQLMRPKLEKTEERVIEKVVFSNVVARNLRDAFDITTMGVDQAAVTDLLFDNLLVSGMTRASVIQGLRQVPISGMTIQNSRFVHTQETMKSWLSCSHVRDLTIRNVELDLRAPLDRIIELGQADGFCWDNVSTRGEAVRDNAITIDESARVEIRNVTAKPCKTYVRVGERPTRQIRFHGTDLSDASEPFVAGWHSEGVRPLADAVRHTVLEMDREIDPGSRIKMRLDLENRGRAGAFLASLSEGGKAIGGRWLLLGRGERRTVALATEPLYASGTHEIDVCGGKRAVSVREAPGAFTHPGPVELSVPVEDSQRVRVPVRNVGGRSGVMEVQVEASDGPRMAKQILLAPGESSFVRFDDFEGASPLLPLRVNGYPDWPYCTYANADARFFLHTDGRIEIRGGGAYGDHDRHAVVYVPRIAGDYAVTCRVLHQDRHTGEYAAVGLISRNVMTDDASGGLSKHFRVPKYGKYKIWYIDRDGDGCVDYRADGGHCELPVWFKLEKRGKTFRAFTSLDGENWLENDEQHVLNHAAETQDVGVFANAFSASGGLCKVVIDGFRVETCGITR